MTMFTDVRDFHEKYGCAIADKPSIPQFLDYSLRRRLILEEVNDELIPAMDSKDLVEIADAIADSIYVLLGTAVSYGIDMDRVFDIVHESNMTKDGDKDLGGKVTKGESFVPPDVAGELERQCSGSPEEYKHKVWSMK